MKFRTITSIDGVEPRNKAAKIIEKITIYSIATDATITTYDSIRSHAEDRLSIR